LFELNIINPRIIKTPEYTTAKKPLAIKRSERKYNPYKKMIGIKKLINEFNS
jgi:hypothetical protein